MKNEIKKSFAALLALILLFSSVSVSSSAALSVSAGTDPYVRVSVNCASDSVDDTKVSLYVHENDFYISADDAARFSAFLLESQSDDEFTFVNPLRGGIVTVKADYIYNNTGLFRLDTIMEKLRTSVFLCEGYIVFRTSQGTFEELGNIVYDIFYGDYKDALYCDDTSGAWGTVAVVGAATYNIISSVGCTEGLSYITGSHSEEQYNELFIDLIGATEEEWVSMVSEAQKTASLLGKIFKEELESDNDTDLSKLSADMAKWGFGDSDDQAKMFLSYAGQTVDWISDPFGSIVKAILADSTEPIKDATGSSFTLSGMDVISWLTVINYINGTVACSASDFKMLVYSFYKGGKIDKNLTPQPARSVIGDLYEMYTSDDVKTGHKIMVRDMLEKIAHSTAKKVVGGLVVKTILGASNLYAFILSMAQIGLKLVYDKTMNASKKFSYVEKSVLIRDLHDSLRCRMNELLATLNTEKMDPLAFKYTAMLYLRLGKLNQQYLAKADGQAASDSLYTMMLNKLYALSDYELANGIYIERIPADTVSYEEIKEPEKSYDSLVDFLGAPFDKVREYYGEPNGGMGIDGNGECLSYETGNCGIMFMGYGYGSGVVSEIWVYLQDNSDSIPVCPDVHSRMNLEQLKSQLTDYSCEVEKANYQDWDGNVSVTWLYAESEEASIAFHWSSTGFNRNDSSRSPCCIYFYAK